MMRNSDAPASLSCKSTDIQRRKINKRNWEKGKYKFALIHATKAYWVNGLELHSFLRSPLDSVSLEFQCSSSEKSGTSSKFPCNIFRCCKKQYSAVYKRYLHSNEKVRGVWLLADSLGRTRQHRTTKPQITFFMSLRELS